MNKNSYTSLHNHTAYSNLRLRDAIIKVPELLDNAVELGLNGLAITDHEALSSHIEAKRYVKSSPDKFSDMKLIFGNEIYLIDKDDAEQKRENNDKIRFNHFVLLAKNEHGYKGLMKQSTKAWENGFFYRGMQRVPTYYDDMMELMKMFKGDIIGSSACLGGIIPQLILEYHAEHTVENYQKIVNELKKLQNIFGEDDFYLELQPSNNEEQKIVNDYLVKIARAFNIKMIVTTDSHYLSKKQKEIHKIYLQSNGDDGREVDDFYDTTYMMSPDTLGEFFEDKQLLQEMFDNTNKINEQIEEYNFEHATIIPDAHIPEFDELKLSDYDVEWDKYPTIKYYETSKYKADKYYIKLIIEGLVSHNQEFNDRNLSRVEEELDIVKEIGDFLGKPMSSYFLADKEFLDIMWETSLVGVARGSASSFYTNYLIDIVQINALDYDLPAWRFLNKDRLDSLPDIDNDAESSQRDSIIENVKAKFGKENVINIGTFTTEGTRSAVQTASRGVGLSISDTNNLLDMIPNEKGINWSLTETIYGSESKKPVTEFVNEIEKYPFLKETMLAIEGIVSGVSVHASGVIVMNDGYVNHFPSLQTRNGVTVSQYDAHGVEYVGGLKFDFLSIDALSRIRSSMDLLIEHNEIEWKGSIKETYDTYLHPDNIDVNNHELFDAIYSGEVPNLFQFSTGVGLQGLQKVKPSNFDELAATNSLIRLTTDGEQPIDKYVRFKHDIGQWYLEMDQYGLTNDEKQVMIRNLSSRYGIADTQELLMILSMDKDISAFSLKEANKLRKSVAKKDIELQKKEKELFFKKAKKNGTSDNLAKYVWEQAIEPQLGYSFSFPHIAGYSLISIIEAYISAKYGAIYWRTASLSVDAGLQGDKFDGINYVKLSAAVSSAKNIVQLPDINRSNVSFTPDKTIILFGLGGVSGLSLADINAIIENRPYNSFDNFMEKVGKDMSTKKIITLIKAGVFHEFDPSTRSVAIYYLSKYTERKTKLTTVQLPKIINDIPDEFATARDLYIFKNALYGRNAVKMSKELEDEFFDKWEQYGIEYEYVHGVLVVDKKTLDKVFNNEAKELKEWLKTDDAIELLARMDMRATWIKEMTGNEASWYFSTLSYYPYKHQLATTGIIEDLNIKTFSELPVDGKYVGKRKQYEKVAIAGTVISKNIKGVIDIITTNDEVISVRVGKDRYGKYNKKIMSGSAKERVLESDSFFNRGETLLFIGYRRGNDFIANNYGTNFEHPVMRIKGYSNYTLEVR